VAPQGTPRFPRSISPASRSVRARNGDLQSFDERFERMTAWQARRNPGASRQEIEQQTLDYMATMPAWKDHPRVMSSRFCLSTCAVSHTVLQARLWGQP
jgi:hypothetical protein